MLGIGKTFFRKSTLSLSKLISLTSLLSHKHLHHILRLNPIKFLMSSSHESKEQNCYPSFPPTFFPVNSNNKFEARRKVSKLESLLAGYRLFISYFKATKQQLQKVTDSKEFPADERLVREETANLTAWRIVFLDQVKRVSQNYSNYELTLTKIFSAIDRLRTQSDQESLTDQLQYGNLLWRILDVSAQKSLFTFYTFPRIGRFKNLTLLP